jgi:hypothetical protein
MATISKIDNKESSNDCGGFQAPKGHLDTQMYPECVGTDTDRNIVKKEEKRKKKNKKKEASSQDNLQKHAKHSDVINQEWSDYQAHANDPLAAANFLESIKFAKDMGYSDVSKDPSTRRGLDKVISRWLEIKKFREMGPVQEEMFKLASKASAFLSMSSQSNEEIYAFNLKKTLVAKKGSEGNTSKGVPESVVRVAQQIIDGQPVDPNEMNKPAEPIEAPQSQKIPKIPKSITSFKMTRHVDNPAVKDIIKVVNSSDQFVKSTFAWRPVTISTNQNTHYLDMEFHVDEIPLIVEGMKAVGSAGTKEFIDDIQYSLPAYYLEANNKNKNKNTVLSEKVEKTEDNIVVAQVYEPGINSVHVVYPGNKEFDVPIKPEISAQGPEEILEYVFEQTQHHPGGTNWIDGQEPMRSSMVGDLYIVANNNWVVLGTGFAEISPEQAAKWVTISDRDRLMAFSLDRFNEILGEDKSEQTTEMIEAKSKEAWARLGKQAGWLLATASFDREIFNIREMIENEKQNRNRDYRIAIEPGKGETYNTGEPAMYFYGTYPESSVNHGMTRRVFISSFENAEEAQEAASMVGTTFGIEVEVTQSSGFEKQELPLSPPDWFDPDDAGEVWSEDDY